MDAAQDTPRSVEQLLAESDWLRKLARGLVLDPHTAEDLVQDTLTVALRRAPQTSASDLRAWLTVVLRNFSRRQRRDTNLRALHEPIAARDEAVSVPEDVAVRVELQRGIAEAVLDLAEPYRSAIVLRYFDDLSTVQVAAKLGISHDNARQRISRGLSRLRSRLDRDHGSRAAWILIVQPLTADDRPMRTPAPSPLAWIATETTLKLLALAACAVVALTLWFGRSDAAHSSALDTTELAEANFGANEGRFGDTSASSNGIAGRSTVAAWQPDTAGGDAWITGEVRDDHAAPVPNASVSALVFGDSGYRNLEANLGSERHEVGTARTDERGLFRIAVGPREIVQLEVDAGQRGQCVLGEQRAGEHVIATVVPCGSIRGHLAIARTGEPLAGASVSSSLAKPRKGEQSFPVVRLRREAHSDAAGNYLLEALPPGSYEFVALLAGGSPVGSRTVEVSAGLVTECSLDVSALSRVRGTIRDALTGLPIVGAEVATSGEFSRPVRSNAHGEFELLASAEMLVEVDARAPGYGLLEREVAGADATTLASLDLDLLRAGRCKGVVLTSEGIPIAGAYVAAATIAPRSILRIDWRATQTDSFGAFEIGDLGEGRGQAILLRKQGFGARMYTFPTVVLADELLDLGEIRLATELEIAGIVRQEAGAPLPDVRLALSAANRDRGRWNPDPDQSLGSYIYDRTLRSDASGRFSFAELSAGEYRLDAYLAGHNDPVSVFIALEEGRSSTDVQLIVPPGHRFSGLVKDAQGLGLPNANVCIEPEVGDECGLEVFTDARGHFQVLDVPPGNYTLSVRPGEALSDPPGERCLVPRALEHAPAGKEDIEIVLEEGAWLRGTVFESDGTPAKFAFVEAMDASGKGVAWTRSSGVGQFEFGVARDQVFTIVARPGVLTGKSPGDRARDPDPAHAARAPAVVGGGSDITIRLPER